MNKKITDINSDEHKTLKKERQLEAVKERFTEYLAGKPVSRQQKRKLEREKRKATMRKNRKR